MEPKWFPERRQLTIQPTLHNILEERRSDITLNNNYKLIFYVNEKGLPLDLSEGSINILLRKVGVCCEERIKYVITLYGGKCRDFKCYYKWYIYIYIYHSNLNVQMLSSYFIGPVCFEIHTKKIKSVFKMHIWRYEMRNVKYSPCLRLCQYIRYASVLVSHLKNSGVSKLW